MMHRTATRIGVTVLAAIGMAISGVAFDSASADSPSEFNVVGAQIEPCENEDGYGQDVCYWDASEQGNGDGKSFIAVGGDSGGVTYIYAD